MQLRPDVRDQQRRQEHAHADLRDVFRRRAGQEVELRGDHAGEDGEQNTERSL